MAVVASIQVADVGVAKALRLGLRPPKAGSIPGLRHADTALAAPLRSSSNGVPRPNAGRVALIAFWDSDDDLGRFLTDDPLAQSFVGGWRARLEPLRAFGTWPGLPDGISRSRHTDYGGPTVVLTLGRLRVTGVVRFLRTSRAAELAATSAPGFVWGTALARPPFVSTCSLWSSVDATTEYAYGDDAGGHPRAIVVDRKKPFHHESAFVRFRPYDMAGSLGSTNALGEAALSRAQTSWTV
jgi:hypothetical protein